MTDEDELVIAESLRVPERFGVLYDRYFTDIYRYIAGRLGAQTADDLAAEVFLAAFHGRAGFDAERGGVRGWLYGIATNHVAQHRRSENRQLRIMHKAAATGDRPDDGHEDLVAGRVAAQSVKGTLATALGDMPDADRDVLLLVALADLSYQEVGQALDIPAGTVGSRLNRIRRKLRVALGDAVFGGSHG
ncbi:RNA polymerase sigma factor [Nonomuraea sp. NBC_01738]|uniref:RNA polymerase sigma factor n=1 Tax=Nonomuraea sp. NBC_01738 TaxID=2976003 RepID=UPI002E0F1ED3|nr:RNA polymerase sigma factor [Nonomuraea sp. NBC_01738]